MFEITLRHCPRCKGNLIKKEPNLLVCEECSYYFYINPRPTNGVIIENRHNQLLLVKRKIDPHKGLLDTPGGFVDLNETLEESVAREVREELGCTFSTYSYFTSISDTYDFRGLTFYTICFYFCATYRDEKMKAGDDVESMGWFDKNNIPFEKFAFEGTKEAIKKYITR